MPQAARGRFARRAVPAAVGVGSGIVAGTDKHAPPAMRRRKVLDGYTVSLRVAGGACGRVRFDGRDKTLRVLNVV